MQPCGGLEVVGAAIGNGSTHRGEQMRAYAGALRVWCGGDAGSSRYR